MDGRKKRARFSRFWFYDTGFEQEEGGLGCVVVVLGSVTASPNAAGELRLGLPMHSAEQT